MERSLIIIAGPNGAGKTTFAQDYLREHPFPFLSADDLALKLSPEQPDRAKIEAGRRFSKELREAIRSGRSLVIESTLAGRNMGRILRLAKDAGYTTVILFVFLESPEACLLRVKERVEKGGHDVPEKDVRRRFYRSKKNFWDLYRDEVDSWFLFYNAGAEFQQVAFGRAGSYEVTDEELFRSFFGGIEN